jgi:hypothetical protein
MDRPKFEEAVCCGYKRCPYVIVAPDGSVTITDTAEDGTLQRVDFNADQAKRLRSILTVQIEA